MKGWSGERGRAPNPTLSDWVENEPIKEAVRLWLGVLKNFSIFKKYFIYLFLERGEGREKERERNINVWLPLERPLLGTRPQPRHVL